LKIVAFINLDPNIRLFPHQQNTVLIDPDFERFLIYFDSLSSATSEPMAGKASGRGL
jgi:hypothetical protein